MKKLIVKYLEKNYRLSLSSYVSYKVIDKQDNSSVGLKQLLKDLEAVFSVDSQTIYIAFEEWSKIEHIKINNQIEDIKYRFYADTRSEPGAEDINRIIQETNKLK